MAAPVTKEQTRFKKLRETLEMAEFHEKMTIEKANICEKMLIIYSDPQIEISVKMQMIMNLLSEAQLRRYP